MRKVVPRLLGGLGNQLFIYAAARRLALANEAELVIDDVSGFARDVAYRRHYQLDAFDLRCRKALPAERFEPASRLRRYLARSVNRRRPFEHRSYIHQEGMDFDPRLLQLRVRDTLHLEGYWQSERYFKDAEPTVRSDLRMRPPQDQDNLSMAQKIRSTPSVAVHVRFFDPSVAAGGSNASHLYYRSALDIMERRAPGSHYFVFSDQPSSARQLIGLPDTRMTLVAHNQGDAGACADLWLMRQCRHFIIANSTFSWWGAWLSDEIGKIVLAPGLSVSGSKTMWGFAGLLPEDWIKV